MMNRNRGGGGRGQMGPGLLGSAPGYGGQNQGPREQMGVGMQRMMGLGGGGILGSAPAEVPREKRILQQPPLPPSNLLERDRHSFRGGMMDQPDVGMNRDRQNFRGGIMDQPDDGMRERQNFRGGMMNPLDTGVRERQNVRGGVLDQPDAGMIERQNFRGGLMNQPDTGARDKQNLRGVGLMEQSDAGMRDRQNFRGSNLDQPTAEMRERQTFRGGVFDQPDMGMRERQNLRGGLLDQPDMGMREHQDTRVGLLDQPDMRMREHQNTRGGLLDQPNMGMREQQNTRGPGGILDQPDMRMREHQNTRAGLLDQPDMGMRERQDLRGGFMEQPNMRRGPIEQQKRPNNGLLEEPSFRGGAMDRPDMRRGLMEDPEMRPGIVDRQNSRGGVIDRPDMRGGLLNEPDLHRGILDRQDNRGGLFDRPERREMVTERDMRDGLMERPAMDRPDIRGSLMEQPDMRRGILNHPEQTMGFMEQPGAFAERERQANLLEKAEIQMRLIEEERHLEMEASRLNRETQMLHEKQELALTQQQLMMQAQAQMQQQKKGRAANDGLLGSGPMSRQMMGEPGRPSRGAGGGIPSIFDLPAPPGKGGPGKRPGGPARSMDTKRPRLEPSSARGQTDRNQRPNNNNRRDSRDNRNRDRPKRDTDRKKSRFDTSPTSKKRERKDSDSKKGSSSHVSSQSKDGKKDEKSRTERSRTERSRSEKSRSEKTPDKPKVEKKEQDVKTEVTIDLTDKYDPAEPTVDPEEKDQVTAEVELKMETEDGPKSEEEKGKKKEDEKKQEEEKTKPKEISLTVTVNKKGRSVNDADKKPKEKDASDDKKYKCNVCNIDVFDRESFANHLNGIKHRKKMDVVMSTASDKQALMNVRKQAEDHLRQIEAQKKGQGPVGKSVSTRKALETHCKTCDKKFTGAFKDHKESAEHKAREDRRKAGCKVCKVGTFNSFADYAKHLKSTWHIKNKRQASWPECKMCDQKFKSPRKFVQHCKTDHHIRNKQKYHTEDDDNEEDDFGELVTLDTVGFEDDSMVDKACEIDIDEEKVNSEFAHPEPLTPHMRGSTATSTPKTVIKRPMQVEGAITPVRADEEDVEDLEEFDPNVPVGQKYVVSVSGFFCKLCHKFYNNETAAKIVHCQSQSHFDKLKKNLEAKVVSKQLKEESVSSIQSETLAKNSSQLNGGTADDVVSSQESVEATQEDNKSEIEDVSRREASSCYETADENQDSTMDAESQQDTDNDTLDGTEDGSKVEIGLAGTEDGGGDKIKADLVVESKGMGKGSPQIATRGGVAARGQKAKRARKF